MPTPPGDLELNLLREWREPLEPRRIALSAAGSFLFHLLALVGVSLLPDHVPIRETPLFAADIRRSVPLYIPKELTQRDPNRGKITKTLDVRSSAPPSPVPQAPAFRQPVPLPPPVAGVAAPPPPKVEAPRAEQARVEVPRIEVPETAAPPAAGRPTQVQAVPPQVSPQPTPPEKPKLAFERVGSGGAVASPNPNPNPALRLPKNLAEEAARLSSGSSGAFVSDLDDALPSLGSATAAGPSRSNLQLLSDPKGVDFKPYLLQVLATVRSNWLAIIPDLARQGRKGRVLVQFIIDKRGSIPKLVIAESSGTAAFDRAAVAGISAANPFPPLPSTFQGNEIRLQLAFTYNVPQ
ncbi:MAG: TonB family protein [Bryobacteraceae bacterium]